MPAEGPDPPEHPRRPEQSRPARWALVFALAAFAALIWPIYPLFGGIEPRVFGLPMSLAYIVGVIILVFAVFLTLFLWEDENDRLG